MASTVKLSEVVSSRFVHLTPPSEENIERIRADLEHGTKLLLNVPHVFKNEDGKYELLAGHDRTEAARRAGWDKIDVRDFSGTVNGDDAILAHFCRENLLRKDVSKAAIAGEWLKKHPDWTDVRVAAESGCDNGYVGEVRAKLVAEGLIGATQLRTTADGKERKYTPRAERKRAPAKPKVQEAEPEDTDQMMAVLAARTNPAPQAVAVPARPSAGVVSGAETPGDHDGIAAGQRENAGASSSEPEITPAVREVDAVSEPVRLDADLEEAVWSAVADLPARALILKSEPRVLRSMARLLSDSEFAGIKDFHRALGMFVLQAEISRKEARPEAAA